MNTCSVTAEADRAARAFIRRAHRLNPEARIVATGCYAQRAPEELAALAGVAAVVGNSHKAFAPEIALSLARHPDARPESRCRSIAIHDWSSSKWLQAGADRRGSAGSRRRPLRPLLS